MRRRLAEAAEFARSLEGLAVKEACDRATDAGFAPVVLRDPHSPLTADLRVERIHLHADANDRVVRAEAG